jgi:hypothetical protein
VVWLQEGRKHIVSTTLFCCRRRRVSRSARSPRTSGPKRAPPSSRATTLGVLSSQFISPPCYVVSSGQYCAVLCCSMPCCALYSTWHSIGAEVCASIVKKEACFPTNAERESIEQHRSGATSQRSCASRGGDQAQPHPGEHLPHSGTVVLQWCYSGVTVVLQWWYTGVTVMFQWCASGFRVVLKRIGACCVCSSTLWHTFALEIVVCVTWV